MNFDLYREVIQATDGMPMPQARLLIILQDEVRQGRSTWVGNDLLARRLGTSTRHVRKVLSTLVDAGYLRTTVKGPKRHIEFTEAELWGLQGEGEGGPVDPPKAELSGHLGGTPEHLGGTPRSSRRNHSSTEPYIEPKEEPSQEPTATLASREGRVRRVPRQEKKITTALGLAQYFLQNITRSMVRDYDLKILGSIPGGDRAAAKRIKTLMTKDGLTVDEVRDLMDLYAETPTVWDLSQGRHPFNDFMRGQTLTRLGNIQGTHNVEAQRHDPDAGKTDAEIEAEVRRLFET